MKVQKREMVEINHKRREGSECNVVHLSKHDVEGGNVYTYLTSKQTKKRWDKTKRWEKKR